MAKKISQKEARRIKKEFIHEYGLDNQELGVAVGLSSCNEAFIIEVRKTKQLPRGLKLPKHYKGLDVNVIFVGRIVAF